MMLANLSPEMGSWNMLVPPLDGEIDVKIEVGVVVVHPAINRVAYTTRARSDNSEDIGSSRIIVQDFGENNEDGSNGVVASSSLRELVTRINEFRTKHLSTMDAYASGTHSHEILRSLSVETQPTVQFTVQTLGAVQNLAFLSRDAIRAQVPSGYVRADPSTKQRLMIGFRRCFAVVSLVHREKRDESSPRGIEVIGYIGPEDFVEYELDDKYRRRLPSSFPIPISENIIAYGAWDGGIRFYDVFQCKQGEIHEHIFKSPMGNRITDTVRIICRN